MHRRADSPARQNIKTGLKLPSQKTAFTFALVIVCLTSVVFVPLIQTAATSADGLTPTPTLTPVPTATSIPDPATFDAVGRVQTLCVQVKVTSKVTGTEGPASQLITDTLAKIGVKVVATEADCDATLNLTAQTEGVWSYYENGSGQDRVACYTGAYARTQMRFAPKGAPAVEASWDLRGEPPGGTIYDCPTETSAPVSVLLDATIFNALTFVWGMPILKLRMPSESMYKSYADRPIANPADTPALLAMLNDKTLGINRQYVTIMLGKIGPDAAAAIPTLVDLLLAPQTPCEAWYPYGDAVGDALGKLGPKAADYVPRIADAIRSSTNPSKQSCWLHALGSIRPISAQTISMLGEAVKTNCKVAANELAGIGTQALSTVPALMQTLQKASKDFYGPLTACSSELSNALVSLDPTTLQQVVPLLLQIGGKNGVPALRQFGSKVLPLITAQITNNSEANGQTRVTAIELIRSYGADAAQTVPLLISLFDQKIGAPTEGFSGENQGLCELIVTVGEIGPKAIPAVPALVKHIGECSSGLNDLAVQSLQRITGENLGEDPHVWQKWRDDHSQTYGFQPDSPDLATVIPVVGIGGLGLIAVVVIIRRRNAKKRT